MAQAWWLSRINISQVNRAHTVDLVLLTVDNDPINKVDSLAGSIQVDLEELIVAWKILLSLEKVRQIFIVMGHGSL